MENIKKF